MTDNSAVGFERGWSLFQQHLNGVSVEPFQLFDREWDLLEGVFAPSVTPVTRVFTEWLPFVAGSSFLDIGCGAGVTSVMAALKGCAEVLALDISAAAVENTYLNSVRHGVEDVVSVLQSDLFDALTPGKRYDLIFWNSNFAEPPSDFSNDTDLHHAFFDPGYVAHRRFLTESFDWLAQGGRLLLGFSDMGNWSHLSELCGELRLEITQIQTRDGRPAVPVVFQLLEIRRAVGG